MFGGRNTRATGPNIRAIIKTPPDRQPETYVLVAPKPNTKSTRKPNITHCTYLLNPLLSPQLATIASTLSSTTKQLLHSSRTWLPPP